MAGFKIYVIQELSELHASIERIKEQIAPLQRELERLQTKSDALNTYLEADEESSNTEALIAEHILDRRNAVELIENILRKAARPLHYKEILIRLKTEENFDMPGKDPGANITARLSINPQFVRVDKGTYMLSENPPREGDHRHHDLEASQNNLSLENEELNDPEDSLSDFDLDMCVAKPNSIYSRVSPEPEEEKN